MIEDILKQFKNNLVKKDIDISSIYFEITDINKIYNLDSCDSINSSIKTEKFLKFKMSSVDLYKIVNAEIHPEDLMFDKKIKISGDISIIS